LQWLCSFLTLTHHHLGNEDEAAKWRERAAPPKDAPWDEQMMARLVWLEVEAIAGKKE
jgi:hypothetical protein